jgi:hypothetical protein
MITSGQVALLEAPRAGTVCRDFLQELGALESIPRLTTQSAEPWLFEIEHGRAFLVGLIDGEMSLGAIVDASSLPMEAATRILAELLADGIIAVQPPRVARPAIRLDLGFPTQRERAPAPQPLDVADISVFPHQRAA